MIVTYGFEMHLVQINVFYYIASCLFLIQNAMQQCNVHKLRIMFACA